MRLAKCDVMLGGELYQQIHGKIVTIAEVAILQHIHGRASVFNVAPLTTDYEPLNKDEEEMLNTDQTAERERLRHKYGMNRKTGQLVADEVYQGQLVKMPNSLKEIGMDPKSQAALLRTKIEELAARAEQLDAEAALDPDDDEEGRGSKRGKKAA